MTEDEQEAESHRYADAIKVLPLSSGKIALLGPRNELHKIVDNWTEVLHNIGELRTAFKYVQTKGHDNWPDKLRRRETEAASINIDIGDML